MLDKSEFVERICSVSECDRPSRSLGLCKSHYGRWRKSGVWPTTPIRDAYDISNGRVGRPRKSFICWQGVL